MVCRLPIKEKITNITHLRKSLLTVLFVVAAAQIACNFGGKASSPGDTQPATNPAPLPTSAGTGASPTSPDTPEPPTAAPPSLSGDPLTAVLDAFHKLGTLSYRKLEWFSLSPDAAPDLSQPPNVTFEYVPPDSTYAAMGDAEYITVNGNFYTRKVGEEWELSVPGEGAYPTEAQRTELFMKELEESGPTVQALGSESLNGIPAHAYHVAVQVDVSGTPTGIEGKVWIGDDGLMVRMDLYFPGTQQVYDISTYEYDPTIKIEAPLP